jgi:hypothetical protein
MSLLNNMVFLFYTLAMLVVLDVPDISFHVKVLSIIFWIFIVHHAISYIKNRVIEYTEKS